MALGLQRLVRELRHYRCRILCGLGAQAVLFVLRKGRSLAWSLPQAVARCAALTFAGDLMPTYLYIQSELSVADAPIRGVNGTRCSRAGPYDFVRLLQAVVGADFVEFGVVISAAPSLCMMYSHHVLSRRLLMRPLQRC